MRNSVVQKRRAGQFILHEHEKSSGKTRGKSLEQFKTTRREFTTILAGAAALGIPGFAAELNPQTSSQREIVSLDGEWQIQDSVEPEAIPHTFEHTAPVPGLAHLATPPFPEVDEYQTREHIGNKINLGLLPKSADNGALGQTPQKRNYFWFQRTFTVSSRREVAILQINKAQFGTAVWLNGNKIGEHLGCFTRGNFNLTAAIDWESENRLLIRIGAHPGALPKWVPAGTDEEKPVWTAGIYDSVALHLCDNPVIELVQAAPQIQTSSVIVQTRLHNYGSETQVDLVHRIQAWKTKQPASRPAKDRIHLAQGEVKTVTHTIPIDHATLWSPENPFLYLLETSTRGDSCSTRFGMREFRFDTLSRRALLNGRPYFLRGSNITLHRFFGDPLSRQHPWEDAWVRKLLGEIPKRMHWNCARICIGPAPEMWLDIADEVGLLLQYEYAIWTGKNRWRHELWKTDELIGEFTEFVEDNCNHPSIAIWNASNETTDDVLREKVIPAVRPLDLSNRPWDNGYNVPQGPNDPYDDHPYIFSFAGQPPFYDMRSLQNMEGPPLRNAGPSAHAAILNEYDSLFLKRDGTPTFFSKKFFDNLVGPDAPVDKRFELRAYLLGGLTEFWRAFRYYAGVLYLPYLDADLPTSLTADNFADVEKLIFQPHFEQYLQEAFKPLGVYIDMWKPSLNGGAANRIEVMMVNDEYETARGQLVLAFSTADGKQEIGRAEASFEIPALGQMTYVLALQTPAKPGDYLLSATADWTGRAWSPVTSRRKVVSVPT